MKAGMPPTTARWNAGKGQNGTFKCKAMARPCLPPGTLPENVPKIQM